MKPGRLVIPAVVVAVVAILGLGAAGLALASAPATEQTPAPALPVESATDLTTLSIKAAEPMNAPEQAQPSQQAATLTELSDKEIAAESAAPDEGTVYTWEDGDRTLTAILQTDLVAQDTGAITTDDVVVARGVGESIVQKEANLSQDALPVFRSETDGGLMMLPGGVLLALDPAWDQARVDDFFAENNIPADRMSALGLLENGFLVETAPGFPSLELANELAAKDGVLISSPNWWRAAETK